MASSSGNLENLKIKEMRVVPCTNSPYIQSSRVMFKQVHNCQFVMLLLSENKPVFLLQDLHTTGTTRCNNFVLFFSARMDLIERGTI